jgi:hypothetical protein
VEAWGFDASGQAEQHGVPSNIVAISAGTYYSMALACDQVPVAFATSATGWARRDIVIAVGGQDPEGDPLTYRIVDLPQAGTLWQCEDGARGAAIETNGVILTDPEGRVVFAPAAAGFGAPYARFLFSAYDGICDSPPATVDVSVIGVDVHTLEPAYVTGSAAGLRGEALSVAPDGWTWFVWGDTTSYGLATEPQAVESGTNWVPVADALTNLLSNSVFHCALVVSNVSGIATGDCVSFAIGPDTNRIVFVAPTPGTGAARFTLFAWPGQHFDAYKSTNMEEWLLIGPAIESPPGYYIFTDPLFTEVGFGFYRLESP